MELLGFINQHRGYPAPVLAVVRHDDRLKLVTTDGDLFVEDGRIVVIKTAVGQPNHMIEVDGTVEDFLKFPRRLAVPDKLKSSNPLTHVYVALNKDDVRELPRQNLDKRLEELIGTLSDQHQVGVLNEYLIDMRNPPKPRRGEPGFSFTPPEPPAP